jgi:hypothetical protein
MRHHASRTLHDYWDSLRNGLVLPDRNDLDPAVMGRLLQDVFILGTINEQTPASDPAWMYRVAGTRLTSFAGRDLKDDLFLRWWRPEDRADVSRTVRIVADESVAMVGGVDGTDAKGGRHDMEMLLLPLRHGGKTCIRIIGGLFPSARTAQHMGLNFAEIGLLSLRSLSAVNAPGAPVFGQPRYDFALHDFESANERRSNWRVIEGGRADL